MITNLHFNCEYDGLPCLQVVRIEDGKYIPDDDHSDLCMNETEYDNLTDYIVELKTYDCIVKSLSEDN